MPDKFNELLLKQDIIELYNAGITPDYGYLMNGRFEKDMIKTLYSLKTLSGNPISWEASDTEYLFPVVNLEPKQAGSGDPSPDNVRPITGWESLPVTRCGKNLIDIPKIDQSTPGGVVGTSVFVKLATTITLNADYSSVEITENIWRFKIDFLDGSLLYATDDNLNGNISSYVTFKGTKENPITSITYRNTFITSGELFNIMCNIGSTPEPYEPYQGNDYTLTLPETIYGGAVDAVTGVGEKTWGYIASYNGESLPGEWISDRDVYSAGASPTAGAQVAYKLATPEPFQATGNQALTSLLGYNTMYTNGDSITLNRKQGG